MIRVLMTAAAFLWAMNGYAQNSFHSDSASVMAVIKDVFDGMRMHDSSMMSQHFHPDLVMQTVGNNKKGEVKLSAKSSPDAWLNSVARLQDKTLDEKTWNHKIHIADNLASVWMDYAFFLNGSFSHCGVNSFTLVKTENVWKIIFIIDTRNKDNCDIPDSVK